MPYLQVDLDGKRKWPLVAAGLGLSEAVVTKGFLDLWEMCWRERTDCIGALHLEMLFPGAKAERIAEVLGELGFLEPSDDVRWRVRGSSKYLRISESRSEGARKTNAKRWGAVAQSSLERQGSDAGATLERRSTVALTPITDHQSPNTEQNLSPASPATGGAVLKLEPTPAKKQRKPSAGEALFARLEESRREACAGAGVEFTPERWKPERVNAQLGPIAKSPPAEQEAFEAGWSVYAGDLANAAKDPPFSIGFFLASRSTWESKAKRAGGAA